jgi:hypothetical protein
MSDEQLLAPAPRLHAIRVDPERCTVEMILIDADEVAAILCSERIDTVDLDADHCLVIDDGGLIPDHAGRFRMANGPARPFFGPALMLGVVRGSWASVTVELAAVSDRIRWEAWDPEALGYAVVDRSAPRSVRKVRARNVAIT